MPPCFANSAKPAGDNKKSEKWHVFLHMSKKSSTFAVAKVFTMEDNFAIQLFEGKKVRIVWDEEQEKYWFSVVDIVQVLTGSFDYQQVRKYWKVLKGRLIKEENESVTNFYQLKLPSSDEKKYMTDVADLQGIFLMPHIKKNNLFT